MSDDKGEASANETAKLSKVHTPRIEDFIRKSPPGMAHWSGTGPTGARCVDCGHAQFHGYKPGHHTQLKPISCAQFKRMMPGTAPKFDSAVKACRFYIAGPGAPKRK